MNPTQNIAPPPQTFPEFDGAPFTAKHVELLKKLLLFYKLSTDFSALEKSNADTEMNPTSQTTALTSGDSTQTTNPTITTEKQNTSHSSKIQSGTSSENI